MDGANRVLKAKVGAANDLGQCSTSTKSDHEQNRIAAPPDLIKAISLLGRGSLDGLGFSADDAVMLMHSVHFT